MIIDIYYIGVKSGDKGYNDKHMAALRAFAEGCRKTGLEVRARSFSEGLFDTPGDYAVMFGTYKRAIDFTRPRQELLDHQKKHDRDTVVIDSGYVKRDEYYMVGLNGLNGRADFRLGMEMPGDRWEKLGVELKPKREDKPYNHVLLCGQVPWDASVQHTNHIEWLQGIANKLVNLTNRPTIFSRHPLSPSNIYLRGIQNAAASHLPTYLQGCHATICFNSNSGVESVIAGVPTLSFDEGSMVYDISSHDLVDLDDPYFPDDETRRDWANDLAYCQWNIDEMRSGDAAKHILGV